MKLPEVWAAAGRPEPTCAQNIPDSPAGAAAALECLSRAAAECTNSLGVGASTCNPQCGNGKIDAGETCDDGNLLNDSGFGPADICPSDCAIAACTPTGTQNVTVSFNAPSDLVGLTVVLVYDDNKVSIPGHAGDGNVQGRLSSASFSMTPNDLDYALRNVLLDSTFAGIPAGAAFTVEFDTCGGAVTAADFGCLVADTSDVNFAPVAGTSCSVSVP